jgi:hypothetical protein
VIAPARIVVQLLADLAGFDAPSATPLSRRRIGERLGLHAGSVQGGSRHEHLLAPA